MIPASLFKGSASVLYFSTIVFEARFSPDLLLVSLVISPSIVYVFPVPVCPYAKIVQLYPCNTSFSIGCAISL
ncbi:hypothetical protein AX774_g5113 [Zancudomyces culisetae]|uniref:Uncharacterized protein n=1 Tax=Zancudomyces culisetae TaxID=1213189 RepID=A0A1R1PKG7_ZANCU|nr:hypothetical protein AX774_g5113 [Zancudomyces culisetae]|eukprot:OMH81437.1 hypothetical protein AX774_g5113 [Zancudomyces culisetae]